MMGIMAKIKAEAVTARDRAVERKRRSEATRETAREVVGQLAQIDRQNNFAKAVERQLRGVSS